MTKIKKAFAHILCLVFSVIVLSGCSITELLANLFNSSNPVQLAAPTLTLDSDNEKLEWNAVDHATVYYVYVYGEYSPKDEVQGSSALSYSVAISDIVDESGDYTFYVIASSTDPNYLDSNKSNNISYTYVKLDRLSTPTITLDRETKTISWAGVENATSYKVYKDGVYLAETTSTTLSYNFSESIVDYGVYRFQVIAVGDGETYKDSKLSNTKRYFYSDIDIIEVDRDNLIIGDDDFDMVVAMIDNTISWGEVTDIDNYVVVAYTNAIDYVYTRVDTTSFDVVDIVLEDGVYALRVGVERDGNLYLDDKLYYHNTAPSNDFTTTQKIYAFDGQINDYYIENYDELCNIVYYQFILRNEDYTIRFSEDYLNSISDDARFSHKTRMIDKVNLLMEDAFNSFMETCYYNYGNGYTYANAVSGSAVDFRIKLDFYDVIECDTTIEPITVYEQKDYIPYYENYVGTPRDDYFVSDHRFVTTYVTTTEELFWAVTYGYTPLFTSETCRAKVVYDKAKEVLQDIIFQEMTDYEKALAIFDWISLNTSYDHSEYNFYGSSYDNSLDGYYYTEISGFYLEGVFITGNSVCDGFAKAYALMCNMEDIECVRVVGTVNNGGHAWNKVKLGDKWYVVDITWTETVLGEEEILFHSYFLVSDSYISYTHRDYTYRQSYLKYPADDMYNHFASQTFVYKGTEYDKIITADSEFEALFHYMLDNDIDQTEFIVDATTYITGASFDVKLQNAFTIIRQEKFASQYINLVRWNSARLVTYDENKTGFLFNIDITLLIDSVTESTLEGTKNEVHNLITYTNENDLECENTIYVKKELIQDFVDSTSTLEEAFRAFIDEYNILDQEFNYTVTAVGDEAVVYGTDTNDFNQEIDLYGYEFVIVINPTIAS